jgi:hypothetical protein
VKNMIKKSFYKKNNFNMFFFYLKKNKYVNKFNYIFENFKNIIKLKLLIILRNFVLIIFLKFWLFWINNYLNNDFINKNHYFKNINFFNSLYDILSFVNKIKFNKFIFLKFDFFFYNNFVYKKSSEIGKITF